MIQPYKVGQYTYESNYDKPCTKLCVSTGIKVQDILDSFRVWQCPYQSKRSDSSESSSD